MVFVEILYSELYESEARRVEELARSKGYVVIKRRWDNGLKIVTPYGVFYRVKDFEYMVRLVEGKN